MEPSQKKIVVVTCYDATFARICADTEAFDYLLVGDSMGMVVQGHSTTQKVTLEHILYHARAVSRGLAQSEVQRKPELIVDLPFGTYERSDQALASAREAVAAGADWVKVEGPVVEQVRAIREAGIQVCGHIGLTPQTILTYKVQGKSDEDAERLFQEAIALEKAGCELLVLEMVPTDVAERITKHLKIPTIGIGAGAHCSGQVLVLYDLLGLNPTFNPKFLKKFANLYEKTSEALKQYATEVRRQSYPDDAHTFHR